MKRRIISVLLVLCLVFSVSACALNTAEDTYDEEEEEEEEEEKSSKKKDKKDKEDKEADNDVEQAVKVALRQFMLKDFEPLYNDKLVPSIEPYSVNNDFSNVVYDDSFRSMFDPTHEFFDEEDQKIVDGLIKNSFVVVDSEGLDEFFDVYEYNRYSLFPNFVTVDSLMHTYHIYFAYLMKNTEKDYLASELEDLSNVMLDESVEQYNELCGSEWEEAAFKNVVFFAVGAKLQGDSVSVKLDDRQDEYNKAVSAELEKIYNEAGIETCYITNDLEDYTQYKPRGYYEGDEQLEKYFRAMTWYGRIPFYTDDEELNKCSSLIIRAINSKGADSWERIYDVTSFFAGASDDPGYYELKDIYDKCFGEFSDLSEMASNEKALKSYSKSLKHLELPAINSVPVWDGEETVKPCFRFMGQRFTIDAAIMQRLVYDNVKLNSAGEKRRMPDTLDVAGVLGSQTAEEILEETGAFDYQNYPENYSKMKDLFEDPNSDVWNASLYASWLGTLRPLLEEKPEGYPSYKLNDEWHKKSLETFAGSYAELKHDTILYAKDLMIESGGGDIDPVDDRGYVDPEPEVYSSFINLAQSTKDGLSERDMLSSKDAENLDILVEMATTMLTISEKELQNEALTDKEYDFIRAYGGYLEDLWKEVNANAYEGNLSYSYQAPCPVIADIATDPDGSVLEVGTGKAMEIYVVFPIDGELHIGRGSAYSFYQFEQSISDRLTDSEWREMLEPEYDMDAHKQVWNNLPKQPDWTQGYRTER